MNESNKLVSSRCDYTRIAVVIQLDAPCPLEPKPPRATEFTARLAVREATALLLEPELRHATSSPRSLWQTRDCVAATTAAVPVPSRISLMAVERLIVDLHRNAAREALTVW